MSKYKVITEVTKLNPHESEMGRGGSIKFKKQTGEGTSEVVEIPVKTWDVELINTAVVVKDILPELVTYRKLLEVEKTYHRKSFKLNLADGAVYVDWSTLIKQAMGLYGPNSYQEAKAIWNDLSAKKRNTYSLNAERRLIMLLKHNGEAELKLFTTKA